MNSTRPAFGRAAHSRRSEAPRDRLAEFRAKHPPAPPRTTTAEVPPARAQGATRTDDFKSASTSGAAASAWSSYASNPSRTWREFDRLLNGEHGPAVMAHDRELKDKGFLGREAFELSKQALKGKMSSEDLVAFTSSHAGAYLLQNRTSPLGGLWNKLRQVGTIRSWVGKLPEFMQRPVRTALVTFARYGLSGLAAGAKSEWVQGIVQNPLFAQVKDSFMANFVGKEFEGGRFATHLFDMLEKYGSGKAKLQSTQVAADALDLAVIGASSFAVIGEKLGPEKLQGLVKGAESLSDFLRKLDWEKMMAQFAGMTGARQTVNV